MKFRSLLCVLAVFFFGLSPLTAEVPGNLLSRTPLAFEPNLGQAPAEVKFLSKGNGYGLFLTENEAVLTLMHPAEPSAVRMSLLGQNPHPRIEGVDLQAGVSHYLVGDREKWQSKIPHFSKVRYSGVYPGIDVVYYGNQRQLEYDFIVAPGADGRRIQMEFDGVKHLSIGHEGDLIIQTRQTEIRHQRPIAYQEVGGEKRPVEVSFVLSGARRAGFKLGAYDPELPLVIDPKLVWSSYLGGTSTDAALDVAIDDDGFAYITGYTLSPDFWVTNGLQPTQAGQLEAFVTKLSPAAEINFSTYLGGSGDDEGHSIALDADRNIHITGFTSSPNWPVVSAFDSSYGGVLDGYVLKLSNDGTTILYSTYLGGTQFDRGFSIAVDGAGNAVVAGTTSSTNFPVVVGFRSGFAGGLGDAFLTKISPTGSLLYSSFLGGLGNDVAYDVGLDSEGNIILTGFTSSLNFPVANALYPIFRGGDDDAFVTKLNPQGNTLVFSTYLGGSNSDNGVRLAIDSNNNIVVTGYTASIDFPLKNPPQLFHAGGFDAFLIRLHPNGQDADFSTFIGGEEIDGGAGLAIGPDDTIYLVGFTDSLQFYAINAVGGFLRGSRDGFVMKLSNDAKAIVFSSYLGGFGIESATSIVVDDTGAAFVTGLTTSVDFPVATNAFQAEVGGGQDGFIIKIDSTDVMTTTPFNIAPLGTTSIATAGQTARPVFGYSEVEAAGGFVPSGIEIVDLRSVGVLVNEVSMPATPPTLVGRLLARTSVFDNTALSMVNPSDVEVRIDFYFTGEDGVTSNFGFFVLPPHAHVSSFLSNQPFNLPLDLLGTLTFTAEAPLFVTALRVDEGSANPLNTWIPIVDPYTANDIPVTLPIFADGLGWSTEIYLVNTTEFQMDGEVRLMKNGGPGEPGVPAEISTLQGLNSVFPYSIPPRSLRTISTLGGSEGIVAGFADIVPTAGSSTPASFAMLNFNNHGGFMRTTVEALQSGLEFKSYAESLGNFPEALGSTPTVAIANRSDSTATVQLSLTNLDGTPSGLTGSVVLPPRTQYSRFLLEIPGFENLPSTFQGVLNVTTADPGVTAVGFRARYNELELFLMLATGPLRNLTGHPVAVFPHLVDGGGYATQFILVNLGGGSSGSLRYLNQAGQPLNVAIAP